MNNNFSNLGNTFSNNYGGNNSFNQSSNINRINNSFNRNNNFVENKFNRNHYGFNSANPSSNDKINDMNTSSETEHRYTSLDGRKWENYESMVNANMEIYNKKSK